MTELRSLKLRCEGCGTRGNAPDAFDFYIPNNSEEVERFIAGGEIPRKADV